MASTVPLSCQISIYVELFQVLSVSSNFLLVPKGLNILLLFDI